MYASYERPVVPVATNLGLSWPQQSWRLPPGDAVIEFLKPIAPGLDKGAFMTRLGDVIETRSNALADFLPPLPSCVEIGAAAGPRTSFYAELTTTDLS